MHFFFFRFFAQYLETFLVKSHGIHKERGGKKKTGASKKEIDTGGADAVYLSC